jgi:hypothetical protein
VQVLLAEGYANDANNSTISVSSDAQRAAIREAKTAEDMYQVIRCACRGGPAPESKSAIPAVPPL